VTSAIYNHTNNKGTSDVDDEAFRGLISSNELFQKSLPPLTDVKNRRLYLKILVGQKAFKSFKYSKNLLKAKRP